jgi:excisionase family DNA binding protein
MNQEVSQPESPGTLDLGQAAELCKCGVQCLRALARSGAIPATKVGRRWVFSTRLLQEWIDTRSMANVRSRTYNRREGGVTVTRALIAASAARNIEQDKSPA